MCDVSDAFGDINATREPNGVDFCMDGAFAMAINEKAPNVITMIGMGRGSVVSSCDYSLILNDDAANV